MIIYKGATLVTTKLSNDLIVGNFSSNHPFKFVDGNVLPAVDDETCKLLTTKPVEENIATRKNYSTISVKFSLDDNTLERIKIWEEVYKAEKVDVVIVPLPILLAHKEAFGSFVTVYTPFRTGRVADRVDKEKKLHIDKFCI